MVEKVVVAGAGFLGVNTALKLWRKGFEVELIDKDPYHEYIPGLIDLFRDRASEDQLKLHLHDFFRHTGVKFKEGRVKDVETDKNTLKTDMGEHKYDYLVLALGADHAKHGMDISEAEHCYDLTGSIRLDKELKNSDSAAIIGSGYVGIELAGELTEKGIDVTVIDGSTRPMSNSSEKASKIALSYMNKKDIKFKGGRRAVEIQKDKVKLKDGKKIESDTIIWSGGIQASKTVQKIFNVGRKGLPVNPGLCSEEYENIFAGGDCADHDYIKTAHNAMEQADTIAENIDKNQHQELQSFEEVKILAISLGNTGIISIGDRAYKNKLFRYLKDLIRKRYWFSLRKEKLIGKILS